MTAVKSLVRIPLIIAAALVVVRLVLELFGLSGAVNRSAQDGKFNRRTSS